MIKKNNLLTLLFGAGVLLYAKASLAVCPLCTIAVAGGVGLSRYLGVDDSITGLWAGGLTMSLAFWTFDWLQGKKWTFPGYKLVTVIAYYLIVIVPLYWMNIFGTPLANLSWMKVDKMILGIITGSVVFWAAASWHFYLKAKNNDKVYFPYQKVVIPVVSLIIISFIFYFLI